MSVNIKDSSKPNGLRNIAGRIADDKYSYQDALSLEEIEASTPSLLTNKIPTAEALKNVNNKITWWIANGYLPDPDRPLIPLIPKMTSDTSPSGTASASSVLRSGMEAYKVFAKDEGNRWGDEWAGKDNQSAYWVQYHFTKPVLITSVDVAYGANATDRTWIKELSSGQIQASNDGSTWTTLATFNLPYTDPTLAQTSYIGDVTTVTYYSYIRFYTTAKNSGSKTALSYMQVYGYIQD